MSTMRIDLSEFTRRAGSVALVREAADLFGLLTRSVDVPTGWAALATREAGDTASVRGGEALRHDGVVDVLFVRTTPLDLTFAFDGVASSDGYQCDAQVSLRVALVTERAELKAFRNAVMGSAGTASIETVQRHVAAAVWHGLEPFAGARPASALVDAEDSEALAGEIEQKLKPVLFAAGLTQDTAARVAFVSENYQQVRQTQELTARKRDQLAARQQLQEAVRSARQEHTAHLDTMLGELQGLADKSPDLSLADLVRTYSERDRGALYQALWRASPEQCLRWAVVAAGEELLFFDPANWESPVRRRSLASDAGPLRSVTVTTDEAGRTVLLVGAARGVHVLEPDAEAPRATYLFNLPAGQRLRSGVNSAALGGGRVFATHSQMGLVVWPADQPTMFVELLADLTEGAKSVRHAQVLDGRLWLTAENCVIHTPLDQIWEAEATRLEGSTSRLTALAVHPPDVYAGNEDGQILHWSLDDEGGPTLKVVRSSSGRPIESIDVLWAGGVQRVLFADGSTALNAQVLGDSYLCRYDAKEQRVRRAAAAGDWLVAMNEHRDRLLCWRPNDPDAPAATVHVGRICGRSIQDLCVVTRQSETKPPTGTPA